MGWIGFFSVLLLLFLLLMMRVRFRFTYDEEFTYRLEYIFFRFRMNKKEKGKTKQKPQKQQNTKDMISEFLKNFREIADFIEDAVKGLIDKIRVDKFEINMVISEEDAAQTALRYGEACASVYGLLSFFENFLTIKKKKVHIQPVFAGAQNSVRFECVLSIRLLNLIILISTRTSGFIMALLKRGNTNNEPHKENIAKPEAPIHS